MNIVEEFVVLSIFISEFVKVFSYFQACNQQNKSPGINVCNINYQDVAPINI